MARVARVLQVEDLLETVEIYSGANVTAKTYGSSGDDAPPLENDRVLAAVIIIVTIIRDNLLSANQEG